MQNKKILLRYIYIIVSHTNLNTTNYTLLYWYWFILKMFVGVDWHCFCGLSAYCYPSFYHICLFKHSLRGISKNFFVLYWWKLFLNLLSTFWLRWLSKTILRNTCKSISVVSRKKNTSFISISLSKIFRWLN